MPKADGALGDLRSERWKRPDGCFTDRRFLVTGMNSATTNAE